MIAQDEQVTFIMKLYGLMALGCLGENGDKMTMDQSGEGGKKGQG